MWELFFRVRSRGFAGSDTSLTDMSSDGGRCDVKSSELSHSSGANNAKLRACQFRGVRARTFRVCNVRSHMKRSATNQGPCRHTDDLPSEWVLGYQLWLVISTAHLGVFPLWRLSKRNSAVHPQVALRAWSGCARRLGGLAEMSLP